MCVMEVVTKKESQFLSFYTQYFLSVGAESYAVSLPKGGTQYVLTLDKLSQQKPYVSEMELDQKRVTERI